ncbi:Putative glycosyltransferase EpsH [Corynebacterium occultum]|uniref:Glycosyltransferase EpsH n=1 Tax=Corynebacterium occultum TaxID=2675219 RepID=A0A6B8WB05_9CORY|nr:glycosyltransferase [Corynebacterium occultum]QGU08475.1 Putative glycosyltransferase EpsH [Corynebacterium occultum]
MTDLTNTVLAYKLLQSGTAIQQERQWLDRLQNRDWKDPKVRRRYESGISVIVASYLSVGTVIETLRSLEEQSLDHSKFEVIVVCNGPDDGTEKAIHDFAEEFPDFNLRVFGSDVSNAGNARNIGISLAKYEYITFIDADDQVEPHFLENSFSLASEDAVVISPIINCSESGRDENNALNTKISERSGTSVPLKEVPWVLGFNACKLISVYQLMKFKYSTKLRSGEDLVFFANLLSTSDLKVVFSEVLSDSAYLRTLSPDSVSRQPESFDFNVKQRVDCIFELRRIAVPEVNLAARQQLENAQLGFVKRYLDGHPEEAEDLENYLGSLGFLDFPWGTVNRGKAHDLVISYCFSPFSDTSAVVAEKAIAERQKYVDVISNDMSKVRRKDQSSSFLSARWIEDRIVINSAPSFAGWASISQFAEEALKRAESLSEEKSYRSLYSRALWVGSHVAAALYKRRNPHVVWTAEFSDPLRFGVDGQKRPGGLVHNNVSKSLFDVVEAHHYEVGEVETLFDLVEISTFILADEVIFTNQNQMDYMLSHYEPSFRHMVQEKSVVRPHPTPTKSSYFAVESNYNLSNSVVNIGYFGSFYTNRGLGDLFTALINCRAEERSQVMLHIFCNSVEEAKKKVDQWNLNDVVKINPYLPYMEFLNATTKFDVLLVNDISRNAGLSINPFLPSKLSDYRGSGARIWGLIDDGSPLSQQELDYSSAVGDSLGALKIISSVVEEHMDRPH